MSYFQNLLTADFEGNWLLGDRHHIPKFVCPRNAGRGDDSVVCWVDGPYDLSGVDSDGTNATDTLSIVYAINDMPTTGMTFKNWATMSIDVTVTAASSSAVTPRDIITDLNNDSNFFGRFEASLQGNRIFIRQKMESTRFRFYVKNGQAEDVLQFNQRAGVAEIPSFFARHTFDNRFVFDDCQNHLILLDPAGNGVDARIIDEAINQYGKKLGFDSGTVQADWELMSGKSGLFEFTNAVDGSTTIVYPAGAKAGDLSKMTIVSGGNTFVLPHTLIASDLITPP